MTMNIVTNTDGSIHKGKLAAAAAGVAGVGGLLGWWFTHRYHTKKASELAEANEKAIAELASAISELRAAKRGSAPKTKRATAKAKAKAKIGFGKVNKTLAGK